MKLKRLSIFLVMISMAWAFSSEAFACRGWRSRHRVRCVRSRVTGPPTEVKPSREPNEQAPETDDIKIVPPKVDHAIIPVEGSKKPDATGPGGSSNEPPEDEAGLERSGGSQGKPGKNASEEEKRDRKSACNTHRNEIPSGARVTLYANFLRHEAGVVLLEIGGTSWQCELIEWQPNSVTVDLPRLGLVEPRNAEISIVLPDGRIAKGFKVRYVPQPDVYQHEGSAPRPMLPVPAKAARASHVTAVQGGFTLYAN